MNKGKIILTIFILVITSFFVYHGIQSGTIHLYLPNGTEERVIKENYSKHSSGDIRFNKDEQSPTYEMPITIENNSSKLYAYADRKSFAFPNNYILIYLVDHEGIYLSECRVRDGELCDFGKNISLSVGDYRVQFISSEKHTWELSVMVKNLE